MTIFDLACIRCAHGCLFVVSAALGFANAHMKRAQGCGAAQQRRRSVALASSSLGHYQRHPALSPSRHPAPRITPPPLSSSTLLLEFHISDFCVS
ncbi:MULTISPECIES: hypothetical protein, partial [unclassified Iodidimonas]